MQTSWNQTDLNNLSFLLDRAQKADLLAQAQGFKGENFQRHLGAGGAAFVTGTVYYMGIVLCAGEVVSNLHTQISTLGAGISACKMGLYTKAGVLVASTADLGTSWQSTGTKTHALSAQYTVPTTDMYYIALFCTFVTTAPQPLRATAVTGNAAGVGSGSMLFGAQTGQVDLPAPATVANGNQLGYWVAYS